jgi:daunorubicin resistance ABC transporter ATP-binding subunit
MAPLTAVDAEQLVKVFGKGNVRAVDGVSLQVETGTVLGLLGPNGAGKTTIVRILSTILTPDKGRAAILGHDVVKEAGRVRRLIGLAGQYATVDENLTGRENLRMVGRLTHMSMKKTMQRADELLEQFELAEAANRPLKTYSGGMRRRLDLAAALVASPPVLFLDEPTTGLDPYGRQGLWEVIEHLVGAGTTVLLTTQYLEEADRLAERIVVIDHGRVIAEGTPAELKADLGTTVISLTLADGVTARQAAGQLAGLVSRSPVVDGSTVELTVEEGPRVAAEALRLLDGNGVPVRGLALREPSLDDVFLSLTGHRAESAPSPDEDRGGGTDGARQHPPDDDGEATALAGPWAAMTGRSER